MGRQKRKHDCVAAEMVVAHERTLRAGVNSIFLPLHSFSGGCGGSAVMMHCCHRGESASAFCTTNPSARTQRGPLAAPHPLCLTCSPCISLPNEFIIILSSGEMQHGEWKQKVRRRACCSREPDE